MQPDNTGQQPNWTHPDGNRLLSRPVWQRLGFYGEGGKNQPSAVGASKEKTETDEKYIGNDCLVFYVCNAVNLYGTLLSKM